ncbi:antirestriction protein ArdA [Amycolatopsis cihanbeyliensis]|uniref:Antirestriction protein n=1 Tax=Amycolatopsis cihanbeyliensis TaxID=1128664 RepID=A0A542DNK2_AMYCI|nr:antirestriction protein ArdA [Amycolatopsis cihanbeyliensis]TQJ04678.1 antirestriction protein [Amycolatopsis cihanbeyliensis]
MSDLPRIYAASLADYNCGHLHGVWIDIDETTDVDEVREKISAMLGDSLAVIYREAEVAEEYAIHDFDNFQGFEVHEFESLDRVVTLARLIAEHGKAFAVFAENLTSGEDIDDIESAFTDQFVGEMSLEDYAYDYVDECLDLPEIARSYFDYEKFARDLELSGDMIEIEGFVFHCR